ncbi:MAG: PAS domain S-box protein [Proteobacteria bacterium]|nr:PAS domain S-box protein [Pseudomonadota bacterium]
MERLLPQKDEMPSIGLSTLMDAEQLSSAMETIGEIVKGKVQKEPMEFQLKTKDGRYLWIETTASLIYKDGRPFAFQGVARNIAERKKPKRKGKN